MTDKLNAALREQADAAGFPPIDLDAVIAGGSRRVRRRRTAGAAAGALGMAAVVALVVTLARPDPVRTAIEPAQPFPTSTRSLDPVIVAGPRIITVGQPETVVQGMVTRLVRTTDTSVYVTDPDEFDDEPGTVHALEADTGSVVDLGIGYDLNADADGHVAAWLRTDPDATRLVVLDTRTMETTETPLEPTTGDDRARLRDVDGRTAYVHDGLGEVGIDLVDGRTEPLNGVLVDAENGVLVLAVPDSASDYGVSLVAETPDGTTPLPLAQSGVLSPDGSAFLTSDIVPPPGELAGPGIDVIDTRTGEHTSLPAVETVDAAVLATEPTGWLDGDTVSVQWISDSREPDKLLTCAVTAGTCQVVVDDVPGLVDDDNVFASFPGMPTYERPTTG